MWSLCGILLRLCGINILVVFSDIPVFCLDYKLPTTLKHRTRNRWIIGAVFVKWQEEIAGLHFARGVKERTGETTIRMPTITTHPYGRAVGKGVVNKVIHLTTLCMVLAIAIIALNIFLVGYDRFITHCTWIFHTWTTIEWGVTTQKQQVGEESVCSIMRFQYGRLLRESSLPVSR